MGAVIGLLLLVFVFVVIPLFARMAIRRMDRSTRMHEWLDAYGPRVRFLERKRPDDETDR